MSRYKITLVGLYQYSDSLFAQLTFPIFHIPGTEPIAPPSKDTLISLILEKGGDFPVVYPDFDFMQFMIGVWSKNCAYMMDKLFATQCYQYNAIHNYDRKGKITRNASSSGTGSATSSQTAFNSDSFKNTGKTVSSDSSSGNETVTEEISGNIGVMSTQNMIAQEREIAFFKWYDIISDDFINKFCIQIY